MLKQPSRDSPGNSWLLVFVNRFTTVCRGLADSLAYVYELDAQKRTLGGHFVCRG
jgi:hypothetical protein